MGSYCFDCPCFGHGLLGKALVNYSLPWEAVVWQEPASRSNWAPGLCTVRTRLSNKPF